MTSKLKGRIATAAVFAFFAIIFCSTLHRGFSPGASAHSIAMALGLESGATQSTVRQIAVQNGGIRGTLDFRNDPQRTTIRSISGEFRTRHLVWRLIVKAIAHHAPAGSLSGLLNGLSALLGALTVAIAFALCRGCVLFINFHDSPVSAEGRKISATAAGLVAALALGLSAPFWLASTRAAPFVFDAFILVLMGWLIFAVTVSQRVGLLFFFGLLCGASIFETDTGIISALLMLAFAVRGMIVGAVLRVKSWCLLLTGLIFGIVAYVSASMFFFGTSGGATMLPIRELMSSVRVGYSLVRGGIFGDPAKLTSVFFVILPFFAMCALAMWRDAERNTAASGFLLFLLACTTFVSLTKTPISPWGVYSNTVFSYLPLTVFILAAATAGYLASAGAIMAQGHLLPPPAPRGAPRRKSPQDDFSEASVGRIVFWFTLCLAIGCGLFNWREIRDSRDEFVATVSGEFISHLDNRSWIASTTPELDTMIRIQAWEKRVPLHIIGHGTAGGASRRLRLAIDRDEAFRELDRQLLKDSLNSTNLDHFVSAWIKLDPNVGHRLMLDEPQPWQENGRTPIPAVIAYRALEAGETPDWDAIASDHLAFWRSIAAHDDILGPAAPPHLRSARSEVRAYLCDIGEHLADLLVKVKDFPATKIREVLDAVEDIRTEPHPAAREEMFY